MAFDIATDLLPLAGRDFRGNPAVRQNLDVVVGEQHVNEDAVVLGGVPHSEPAEQIGRPLPGSDLAPQLRQIERRLDHEAHLTAMLRLHFVNGGFDFGEYCCRKALAGLPAQCEQVT